MVRFFHQLHPSHPKEHLPIAFHLNQELTQESTREHQVCTELPCWNRRARAIGPEGDYPTRGSEAGRTNQRNFLESNRSEGIFGEGGSWRRAPETGRRLGSLELIRSRLLSFVRLPSGAQVLGPTCQRELGSGKGNVFRLAGDLQTRAGWISCAGRKGGWRPEQRNKSYFSASQREKNVGKLPLDMKWFEKYRGPQLSVRHS